MRTKRPHADPQLSSGWFFIPPPLFFFFLKQLCRLPRCNLHEIQRCWWCRVQTQPRTNCFSGELLCPCPVFYLRHLSSSTVVWYYPDQTGLAMTQWNGVSLRGRMRQHQMPLMRKQLTRFHCCEISIAPETFRRLTASLVGLYQTWQIHLKSFSVVKLHLHLLHQIVAPEGW